MNENVLAEPRNLAHQRGYESPVSSPVEFQVWADKVIPRLQFDQKLAAEFKKAVALVEIHRTLGINTLGAANDAFGLLNRAVKILEEEVRSGSMGIQSSPLEAPKTQTQLALPPEITAKWLYEHAPVSLYFWLFGIVLSAFAAGIAVSESQLYQSLRQPAVGTKPSVGETPLQDTERPQTASAP